jgi:hypothetical protein
MSERNASMLSDRFSQEGGELVSSRRSDDITVAYRVRVWVEAENMYFPGPFLTQRAQRSSPRAQRRTFLCVPLRVPQRPLRLRNRVFRSMSEVLTHPRKLDA